MEKQITVEELAVKLLGEIEQHTTLCIDDYERNIFLQGVNAGYNAALSKEENKISKLTFDKEISQWVDIYSYELGLIKGKEEGYKAANAAVKGYREALEKIAMLCDNQNNTHDDIWHIAYAALFKAEDKGEEREKTLTEHWGIKPQTTNSLDELERWLKTYSANSAFYTSDLLAKIQELKTITT
jgi:hypothetical protein